MSEQFRPRIVGIGGTIRPNSSSEKVLRLALEVAAAAGADVETHVGLDLDIPMYAPESQERVPRAGKLIESLRRAHGILIASPGYHGSVSGLIKNALDYAEDLRGDALPYFEGRAVGLIACAAGWQATGTTLTALRSIVHALRGWPTPMAVAVNTIGAPFRPDGSLTDPGTRSQIEILAEQVVRFSRMRALHELALQDAAIRQRAESDVGA